MVKVLLILDMQVDFAEGGALGVYGGNDLAERVTRFLDQRASSYSLVVASRDWHNADDDNGGHFAAMPNYVDSWPPHCVAGSPGSDYLPGFDTSKVDVHICKGQGRPAYSLFEGIDDNGVTPRNLFAAKNVTDVDVIGIAIDFCVRATALDAAGMGYKVRMIEDLVVGVSPVRSAQAVGEMREAGVTVISSADVN